MRTSNLVEWVLKNKEQPRNSDIELIIDVWQEQGLYLTEQQKQTLRRECSKPETIRRIRQKLQQDGKYLANSTVRSERKWLGMRAQQNFPTTTVDKVENLTQSAIPWMNDGCRT